MTLNTPFAELNHPLSAEEFASLRISIEAEGVRDPIWIDEEGNILDGHHRYKIASDAPTRVKSGLSLAQKKAFVRRTRRDRGNSSPEQKAEGRARDMEIARELKEEGRTQEEIAADLGVDQRTIGRWLDISNRQVPKANMDCRVTLPKAARAELLKRVEDSTEKQAAIAADYGISQGRVSQIATQERRRIVNEALKADGASKVKLSGDDLGAVYQRVRDGAPVADAVEFVTGERPAPATASKVEPPEKPKPSSKAFSPMALCVMHVGRTIREAVAEIPPEEMPALFERLRVEIEHIETQRGKNGHHAARQPA